MLRKIRVRIPNDYWIPRPRNTPRQRRSSWDGSVQGRRPCSVERMLSIVGDRWTFLSCCKSCFTATIALTTSSMDLKSPYGVLSGRLANLHRAGFIEKERRGNREVTDLAEMGLDSYGPMMILMKVWGEHDGKVVRGQPKNF